MEPKAAGFMDNRWKTEELVCPQCAERLAARPGDRVFACARCETAFELTENGLVKLSANHVYLGWWLRNRPRTRDDAESRSVVSLPFWRFELTPPEEEPPTESQERIPGDVMRQIIDGERYDLTRNRVYAYLPAFRTRSLTSAFATAAQLTDAQPGYELNAGARSSGASYGSSEAGRLLEAAAEHMSASSPGMALAGLCRRQAPELLAVPFEMRSGRLVEDVSGASLAVDELDAELLEPTLSSRP